MRLSNRDSQCMKLVEELRSMETIRRESISSELDQCFVSCAILVWIRAKKLMARNHAPEVLICNRNWVTERVKQDRIRSLRTHSRQFQDPVPEHIRWKRSKPPERTIEF